MFLAVGDDGNGGGVDVQCRRADEEISQLSDQRETERRASTAADVPFSHRLQHESDQEVSVAGRSKRGSEAQKKASYR